MTALMLVLASPEVHAQQSCTLKDRSIQIPVEALEREGPAPKGSYEVRISLPSDPTKTKLVLVDTGSTGIVIPFMDVPEAWKKSTTLGQILYSSNDVYHPGKVITTPIRLGTSRDGSGWAAEVQNIDILAVQCTCTVQEDPSPKPAPTVAPADCQGYVGTKANAAGRSLVITSCENISPDFGMMGVGYDRGAPTAKNPFLRLKEMDAGSMSPGYEVQSNTLTLGVTEAMLKNYKLISLQPGNAPKVEGQANPPEWQPPTACATFPKADPNYSVCGPVLPDTGLDYMMLTQATGSLAPAKLNPPKSRLVPKGTEMTITVGPQRAPALQYTYKVGDRPPAPAKVEWRGPVHPPPHINTGRYILAGANYLYDAACGHVGFQAVTPSQSK